jgi:heme A synthase
MIGRMASFSAEPVWAPRWLYRWAVATVVATAALLLVGAVVTTFRVGMADPIWPTAPWHLLLISWHEPQPGFLIEHTHRAVGYLVGCFVIVLALGLWLAHTPRWLKTLGGLALGCVIVQGLLGGFRVFLHALLGPNLAAIHGLFAQVVFSLLVSVAVLTSPRFAARALPLDDARPLRLLSGALVACALAQLTWGVLLRHLHGTFPPRAHLLTAFAVVALAAWLAVAAASRPAAWGLLRGPLALLGICLVLQVALGVEAWMSKAAITEPDYTPLTISEAAIRTAHVLVGAVILATTVTVALLVCRPKAEALPRPADTAICTSPAPERNA